MSQIQKKFLKPDSVDESKILLLNNGAVRARNASDSADVDLFKLDGSDKLQLLVMPEVSSDASSANQLVRKSQFDAGIAAAGGDITALDVRVTAIEDDYGAANGLATLDGSGKIPAAQLPSAIMEYQGTWDASTNTPTLANGSGANAPEDAGHVYKVSVAGTVNFGAGPISFNAGDMVILNASLIWEKSVSGDQVDSVNGYQGVVVLATSDIAESGLTNLYYTPARQSAIEAYTDAAVGVEVARALGAESAIASDLGIEIARATAAEGVIAADLADEIARATAAEGVIAGDLAQEILDRAADVDAEESRALAAEGLLDGRITVLENASLICVKVKHVLTSLDISNGYVDLLDVAVAHSVQAFVDRLAIHETDDYTLSVVSGVTRLTFTGSLITPGQENLAVGDEVRISYMKTAV